jgi:dTDP-4-amino-4,6-dideoxygalactose transaminase
MALLTVLTTIPAVRVGVPTMVATTPSVTSNFPSDQFPSSTVEGPVFDKLLSTPDPVPVEGQERAMKLMQSGALFRYTPGVLSETALAEEAICRYSGFKYAVGFNSCGSALFIALKCAGVQPGDEVLCNGFSFTAVPSAVHHAGAVPVYIDTLDSYVLNVDDLRKKITPQTKYMMVTHMRGKVADMEAIYDLAAEHGITVVEDCAHALGIQYDGVQLGRSAVAACFSTQSAKVINSGEGGFLCTDDPEIAARAACYAGCYEQLYLQHVVAPPTEYFEKVKLETPNYSLRMSDLTACCVRPQIDDLEERVEKYNRRYARIVEQIASSPAIQVPSVNPRVRPVCDSLQFNLVGFDEAKVSSFLAHCKRRGMPVGLFGSKDNARNYKNWQYSDVPPTEKLAATEALLGVAIDVRLPAVFEDSDLDQMGRVLLAAVEDVQQE